MAQRIVQFLEENETPVLGMREGAWVRAGKGTVRLGGANGARIFRRGQAPVEAVTGEEISGIVGGAGMKSDGTLLLRRSA